MRDTTTPNTPTAGWCTATWTLRGLRIAAALAFTQTLVVHTLHAAAGLGYGLLGISRVVFAVVTAVWAFAELLHLATRCLRAELDEVRRAVDQLRRELAADMASPLGHLADAVDQAGAKVDALAAQVAEVGERLDASHQQAYWRGYNAGAGDAEASTGPGIARLPRRPGGQVNSHS